MEMEVPFSPLAVVALTVLVFVVIMALANPRTRPLVIGLAVMLGIGVVGASLMWVRSFPPPPMPPRHVIIEQPAVRITTSTAPIPARGSTAQGKWPRMTVIDALRQAAFQAWTGRAPAPIVVAPSEVPAVRAPIAPPPPQPMVAEQAEVSMAPKPPTWVNAPARIDDGCYLTSVQVGPFTTPLECQRELPKAVQQAVGDYAELSQAAESGTVRLADNELKTLVRDQWSEVRPMEIGGGRQDMYSLHALVAFDARAQQAVKDEVQRLTVARRLQAGGVLLGGLLGLLAVVWSGLKLATRRAGRDPGIITPASG